MFLHNVTLIDAAYLHESGFPCGLSINPVFFVEGELSAEEQVVGDFSAVKKEIKDLIDDKESGFDHKLWVDTDVFTLEVGNDQGIATGKQEVRLQTDYFTLSVPANALRRTPGLLDCAPRQYGWVALSNNISRLLADYLNIRFSEAGRSYRVSVHVPMPTAIDLSGIGAHYGISMRQFDTLLFSYTHGLPKSSSWGCQNILHGHTSFVTLAGGGKGQHALLQEIHDYLYDAYVVDSHTQAHKRPGIIRYTTDRGAFKLELSDKLRTVVLDKAPTIENIVDHVAQKYARQLHEAGTTLLAISEGLWKGAHVHCTDWLGVYGGK
jgi:6-pyruvoyl-tetrahydropterin synthase